MGSLYDISLLLSMRKSSLFSMLLSSVILAVSFSDFPGHSIRFTCKNDMQ